MGAIVLDFPIYAGGDVFNVDLDVMNLKEAKAKVDEYNKFFRTKRIFIFNGAKNFKKYDSLTKYLAKKEWTEISTAHWINK